MSNTQTIKATGAADIIAFVASGLGYTPTDSLVVVSVRENQRLGVFARIDLDGVDGASLADLARYLMADGAHYVFVLTYSDDAEHADRLAIRMGAVAQVRGVKLLNRVRVASDGYRVDDERAAQPLEDVSATQIAAHNVLRGRVVRETREQTLPGQAKTEARRAAEAARDAWLTRHLDERRADAMSVWARAMGGEASPEVFGRLAGVLSDLRARDGVLVALIPGTPLPVSVALLTDPTSPEVDAAVGTAIAKIVDPAAGVLPDDEVTIAAEILAQVIAHVDDCTGAWTLWALIAWWGGHGAQAASGIARALTLDPTYRLAALVNRAIEAGMPPGWVAARQR